jgi:hypothetical protein
LIHVEELVRPRLMKFEPVTVAEGRGCVGYRGRPARDENLKKALRTHARKRWERRGA